MVAGEAYWSLTASLVAAVSAQLDGVAAGGAFGALELPGGAGPLPPARLLRCWRAQMAPPSGAKRLLGKSSARNVVARAAFVAAPTLACAQRLRRAKRSRASSVFRG